MDIPGKPQPQLASLEETLATGRRTCLGCGLEVSAQTRVCPNDGIELTDANPTGLGDRYEFIEMIGQGGMSSVYKARHILMNKVVAVKLLHSQFHSESGVQRFQREAQAASSLEHPNIVAIRDFGNVVDGQPYMVMDYVDGLSVAALIRQQGKLPLRTALDLMLQASSALIHAHQKRVFHRDIKPSNLMLSEAETGYTVHLIDFGIAKLADPDAGKLTSTGEVIGSPSYMSPEQCMGREFTERSEVYALGCAFFEMLTGRAPFVGNNQVEVIYKALHDDPPALSELLTEASPPAGLQEIVSKALAKDSSQRYCSMAEFRADLEAFQSNLSGNSQGKLPLKAMPIQPSAASATLPKSRSTVRLAVIGVPAILLVVGSGFAVQWQMQNQTAVPSQSQTTTPIQTPTPQSMQALLNVAPGDIDDNFVQKLVAGGKHPNLRKMSLKKTKVTEVGLASLASLPRLQMLDLEALPMSDKRIGEIAKFPALNRLNLKCCNFSGTGLKGLEGCKSLGMLSLEHTNVNAGMLKPLQKLATLKELNLKCNGLVDGDMQSVTALAQIERLNLGRTKITDAGLRRLAKMKNLRWLNLKECEGISSAAVADLRRRLPSCEIVTR